MGERKYANRIASRFLGLALVVSMMVGQTLAFADEDARKVVVTRFAGPEESAVKLRTAVLEIVEDVYDVVPYRKYRVEQRRAKESTESKKKTYAKAAKKIGVDAIVEGAIKDGHLTIRVRAGKNGRIIDKYKVRISSRSTLSSATEESLTDELTEMIDLAEPVNSGVPADDFASGQTVSQSGPRGGAVTRLATTTAELLPTVDERSWDLSDKSGQDDSDARPSPVQFSGSVGVSGTSRTLAFAYKASLSEGQRPQAMAGSPQLGAAFTGTATIQSLGIATKLHYERSVGGKSSVREGNGTRQFGTVYSHWGIGAYVSRVVRKRITLRGGVGYHQLAFRLQQKPVGLLIPDARYAYADVGGGARIGLRDDRIAITADAGYMHAIAISGISDQSAYGASIGKGVRGEVGVEFESSDNSFIRVALNASRMFLYFAGDGKLAKDLDASSDIDVSGATDTYMSGTATMGFNF